MWGIVVIMVIIMVNGSTEANKLRYVFSVHVSLFGFMNFLYFYVHVSIEFMNFLDSCIV